MNKNSFKKHAFRRVFSIIFFILILFIAVVNLYAESASTGVVIGNRVRLRSEANLKCATVGFLNTGTEGKIIGQSDKPENLIKSNEFAYYWYKINAKVKGRDVSGWIYGQFFYIRKTDVNSKISADFYLHGNKYQLVVFSEMPQDYDMPEGNIYNLPFIRDIKSGRLFTLAEKNNILEKAEYRGNSDKKCGFFRLHSNSGYGERVVSSPVVKDNFILIPIHTGLQEGRITFKLKVIKKGDNFHIVDIADYKRMN